MNHVNPAQLQQSTDIGGNTLNGPADTVLLPLLLHHKFLLFLNGRVGSNASTFYDTRNVRALKRMYTRVNAKKNACRVVSYVFVSVKNFKKNTWVAI